ncbi:hypothetical protein BGZ76_006592 [Entomortierella beljakovae]|nr:hypothetical protein BGZ76_006592 [Entomortierella beljakovae]
MSLFLNTTRRSYFMALTNDFPAVTRLPMIARPFSSKETHPIKHAPGWKQENASDSEANVKADREPQVYSTEQMQRESVEHLKNNAESLADQAKEYVDKARVVGEKMSEKSKEYAAQASENISDQTTIESTESIVNRVKTGADKVTQVVVDTAKKVAGMNR